jgi:ankyrin repeat protein
MQASGPLRVACNKADAVAVRALLADGVDPDAAGELDNHPVLHCACADGNEEVAAVLLEYGANINGTDNTGWTPLHFACTNGHLGLVRLLFAAGADVLINSDSGTALHAAAQHGFTAIVTLLMEAGADVTATMLDGSTALHVAGFSGRESICRLLVDAGAEVNATDNFNRIVLHKVVGYGKERGGMIRFLLDAGADVHHAALNGCTPLHYACTFGCKVAVSMLLTAGAKCACSGQ